MSVITTGRPISMREDRQMVRSGCFNEDDRVELANGEVIEMRPISSRHAACVKK